MSKFNPDVPEQNPPNFLGYSKPVEDVKPNTAFGELVKGIGETFSLGVKGLDQARQEDIKGQVRAGVDTHRDLQTLKLQTTADGGGAPMNIIPMNENGEVPVAVQQGMSQAEGLLNAKANGKLSNTYYWGRLNELAKQLRSEHPGYVDLIDHEFSRLTGKDPANANMQSLVSDLNAAAVNAQSETNRIEKLATSPHLFGNPQVGEKYKMWKTGNISNGDFMSFLWKESEVFSRQQRAHADASTLTDNDKAIKNVTEKELNTDVINSINNHLDTIVLPNKMTLKNFIGGAMRRDFPVDETQVRSAGEFYMSRRPELYDGILQRWSQPVQNGKGATDTLINRLGGIDEARKYLDNHFKTYDQITNNLYNKDWGPAFMQKNFNEALLDAGKASFLSSSNQFGLKLAIIHSLAGPNYVKDFMNDIFGSKIPEELRAAYHDKVLSLHTQFNPLTNLPVPLNAPPVTTFASALVGASSPLTSPEKAAEVNTALLGQMNILRTVAPDNQKINIVKAAFDPSGRSLIANDKWSRDDGLKIYKDLTNPVYSKDIYRLDQANPSLGLWKNYKDSMDTWFQRVVGRNELLELSKQLVNPSIKISYNDKTGELTPEVIQAGKRSQYYDPASAYLAAKRNTDALNGMIKNIKAVTDAEGSDITVYLLNALKNADIQTANLPGNMLGAAVRAIYASQQAEPPKVSQPISVENIIPSLTNWLKNPSGEAPSPHLVYDRNSGTYVPYSPPGDKSKDQGRAPTVNPEGSQQNPRKVKTQTFRAPE